MACASEHNPFIADQDVLYMSQCSTDQSEQEAGGLTDLEMTTIKETEPADNDNDTYDELDLPPTISLRDSKDPIEICQDILSLFKDLSSVRVIKKPLFSVSTLREVKKLYNVLQYKSMSVSVFGLHNTGKSTLVNTIIGQSILPVNVFNESSVTVQILPSTNPTPVLEISLANQEKRSVSGVANITTALKSLNEKARNNSMTSVAVELRLSAPDLFSKAPKDWIVSLLDHPGFGENNSHIEQVATSAISSSAAYLFLTTADSIGGTANAEFYQHLKKVDESSFTDGRLLVVITKFDTLYTDQDEDSVPSPEDIVRSVLKHIRKTTGIEGINSRIVLPVSSRWYKFSRGLKAATPETMRNKRERVLRSLSDYPHLESVEQSVSELGSLYKMSNESLVEYLDQASHIPLLKHRLHTLMSRTCVKTWTWKLVSGFSSCLTMAETDLQSVIDLLEHSLRDKRYEYNLLQSELRKVNMFHEELSDCLSSHSQRKLYTELESYFETDSVSSTFLQRSENLVKDLVEEFRQECCNKIRDPMSSFGPVEFESELGAFIGQTSMKLNTFMDNTFVFSALPTAVLKWIDVVVELYNKLNTRASKLENTATHYAASAPSSTDQEVSGPAVRHSYRSQRPQRTTKVLTESTKSVAASNLGDIKQLIFIPSVVLTKWEKVKKMFRSLFQYSTAEFQNMPYRKVEELLEPLSDLEAHLQTECLKYIVQIKPNAVQFYYREYEKKAKKYLADFNMNYSQLLKDVELHLHKLSKRKLADRRQLSFAVRTSARFTTLKRKLKPLMAL